MKRRITKLVVFLLLGAVVNVGVAWACIELAGVFGRQRERIDSIEFRKIWYVYSGEDWAIDPAGSELRRTRLTSLGYTLDDLSASDRRSFPDPPHLFVSRALAGWPSRCVRGGAHKVNANPAVPIGAYVIPDPAPRVSIRISSTFYYTLAGEYRIIPYTPIWPGFAINTVFYAALLWLPSCGPFTARRMIRRKRGYCIKCGYDLRGAVHARCPECGTDT